MCTRLLAVVGCLLCVLLDAADADTIELANGDKITGRIASLSGAVLTVETDYASTVRIQWSAIATVSTQEALLIQQGDLGKESLTKLAPHDPGSTLTDTRDIIPLSSISSITRPVLPSSSWRVDGVAALSADIERETNDSTDYTVSLNTRAETATWRNVLEAEYHKETLNSETTSEHWESTCKLDRLLGEHLFLRGTMLYRQDALATISRKRGLGLGVGYRFDSNEVERFDLTASVGRLVFDLPTTHEYANAVLFQWDYRRKLLAANLEVFTDGGIGVPNVDGVDYLASGKLGLRYKLNQWLHLATEFEFDTAKVNGERSRDEHYILGLGVNW